MNQHTNIDTFVRVVNLRGGTCSAPAPSFRGGQSLELNVMSSGSGKSAALLALMALDRRTRSRPLTVLRGVQRPEVRRGRPRTTEEGEQ